MTIEKREILKAAMAKPYCGKGTRFDYLDDEELPMIFDAMETYAYHYTKRLMGTTVPGQQAMLIFQMRDEIKKLQAKTNGGIRLCEYCQEEMATENGLCDDCRQDYKDYISTIKTPIS